MPPGMKVSNVGSGVGDVAFLAAELVGPDGKVVGVDMDDGALEKGRRRAEQLKLRNVEFIRGDIRNTALSGPYDAAVGRLVCGVTSSAIEGDSCRVQDAPDKSRQITRP